jgi:hypothetical protein
MSERTKQDLLDSFAYSPGDDFQVAYWPGDGPEYYRVVARYWNFDPAKDYPEDRDHREYEIVSPARSGWERERVSEMDLIQHYQEIDEIPDDVLAGTEHTPETD